MRYIKRNNSDELRVSKSVSLKIINLDNLVKVDSTNILDRSTDELYGIPRRLSDRFDESKVGLIDELTNFIYYVGNEVPNIIEELININSRFYSKGPESTMYVKFTTPKGLDLVMSFSFIRETYEITSLDSEEHVALSERTLKFRELSLAELDEELSSQVSRRLSDSNYDRDELHLTFNEEGRNYYIPELVGDIKRYYTELIDYRYLVDTKLRRLVSLLEISKSDSTSMTKRLVSISDHIKYLIDYLREIIIEGVSNPVEIVTKIFYYESGMLEQYSLSSRLIKNTNNLLLIIDNYGNSVKSAIRREFFKLEELVGLLEDYIKDLEEVDKYSSRNLLREIASSNPIYYKKMMTYFKYNYPIR